MPKAKNKKGKSTGITVDKNMRDYSKDPYFIKKAESAAEFIRKHGLPKSFTEKKK